MLRFGLIHKLGSGLGHPVRGVARKRAVSASRSRDGEQKRDQCLFQCLAHGRRKSAFGVAVNPAGWQAGGIPVPWTRARQLRGVGA
jgi:hypothetical protein